MSQNEKLIKTAKEAVDLSVFHLVATLLVPPMLIGAVVKTTGTLLHPPSSKSTPHPEPTGFSPMRAIDKCRDCIEDGLEKITTPIAPHTQQWSDRLINRLHHQFIGESGNAKANRWISRNNRTLSQLVNPVAKTAQFLSKMPIAKWFVSRELADELSGNAKAIALKTSFNLENKELAHLLFLKPIPVLVGVGMVPLIAHPFDELMLKVQNWTLRPLLGKNKLIRDSHGHLQSIRNKAFWGKPESEKRQNIGTGNLPGPSSPANLLTPSVASLAAMSKRQTPAIYGPSFLPPSYYSSRIASTPPILPYPIPASSPESRLRHMPPPFGPTNVFIPSALTSQKWALN